jgi:diguanylate cyclase (GGDEF)-like protein/PAS domain S-box-containing protein
VLNDQVAQGFPVRNSTQLYPEWPVAAMAGVPANRVRDVTMALLTLSSASPAARAAHIHGFYPPANYAPVEALMQRLRVYPRVASMPLWDELNMEYGREIKWTASLVALLALLMLTHLWTSNRRLHQLTLLNQQAQEGLQVTAAAFDSQVGLMVIDTHMHIIRANEAMCGMLGRTETDLRGQAAASLGWSFAGPGDGLCTVWEAVRSQGHWKGELNCHHQSGQDVPCIVTITAVHGEPHGLNGYVGSFVDMTAQKQTEHDIRQLAYYDVLTHLPNRRMFLEALETDMKRCQAQGDAGAVMFIDLDHFKVLNDAHGHAVDDQLLMHIAQRLHAEVRTQDMVARLGGDEFVVMLTPLAGQGAQVTAFAMHKAEAIRHAILNPYNLHTLSEGEIHHTMSYQCSASIGVALYGQHTEHLTEVLKRADVAMYQAKQAGRNAIRLYDFSAQALLNERAGMTTDLSTALARHEFGLHYQLQCTTQGAPVGAECLLRWHHPVRGSVPPDDFIGLAEESGAIVAIGEWVMLNACQTLARWAQTTGLEHLTLSVNVSPRQFNELDFMPRLLAILAQTGALPSRLVLEVTEGIVLSHRESVIEKMHHLRDLGVNFSIDDFGTGYSSLSYLQRLPLSEVKIDKTFVNDMTHNPNSVAIVRAIIALGASLKLTVVSEGVEVAAQKDLLQVLGCDVLQGYLMGRPVALDAFEAQLKLG